MERALRAWYLGVLRQTAREMQVIPSERNSCAFKVSKLGRATGKFIYAASRLSEANKQMLLAAAKTMAARPGPLRLKVD